jgi:hypothetical protein
MAFGLPDACAYGNCLSTVLHALQELHELHSSTEVQELGIRVFINEADIADVTAEVDGPPGNAVRYLQNAPLLDCGTRPFWQLRGRAQGTMGFILLQQTLLQQALQQAAVLGMGCPTHYQLGTAASQVQCLYVVCFCNEWSGNAVRCADALSVGRQRNTLRVVASFLLSVFCTEPCCPFSVLNRAVNGLNGGSNHPVCLAACHGSKCLHTSQ